MEWWLSARIERGFGVGLHMQVTEGRDGELAE